jgi:hypothetical protein
MAFLEAKDLLKAKRSLKVEDPLKAEEIFPRLRSRSAPPKETEGIIWPRLVALLALSFVLTLTCPQTQCN